MSKEIKNIQKEFFHYKSLGDLTFIQLNEKQILWKPNSNSSSIGLIIKHLHGNMKSRWTDFLNSDGEKKWRKRDQEFIEPKKNKKELLQLWESDWSCLFDALDSLSQKDLEKEVFIRNMGQTVRAAIDRQLCHYAYHVGQIVFIGKMITNENWKSLSIRFGESEAYNKERFSKPKRTSHFSED